MVFRLDLFEVILAGLLTIMSLYVIIGIRRGLYLITSKLIGYLPTVLSEPFSVVSLGDTSSMFNIGLTLLDAILSWLSFLLLMFAFYLVQLFAPSMYLEILILYLGIGLSVIFSWRIFRRVFDWMYLTSKDPGKMELLFMIFIGSLYGIGMHLIMVIVVRYVGINVLYFVYTSFDGVFMGVIQYLYFVHLAVFIPFTFLLILWFLNEVNIRLFGFDFRDVWGDL